MLKLLADDETTEIINKRNMELQMEKMKEINNIIQMF